MTEQDAVERVAKALYNMNPDQDDWAEYPEYISWFDASECSKDDSRRFATAAITAYNAWLHSRATDADVVEAAWLARIEERPVLTAALDAMIGKENHDDRG